MRKAGAVADSDKSSKQHHLLAEQSIVHSVFNSSLNLDTPERAKKVTFGVSTKGIEHSFFALPVYTGFLKGADLDPSPSI